MWRRPFFFASSGVELARYLLLVGALGALLPSGARDALTLARVLAAPNLLFAAAFYFMGRDPDRYASYRPLALVGKAASLFAAALALPALLGLGRPEYEPKAWPVAVLAGAALWDAASAAVLLFGCPDPSARHAGEPVAGAASAGTVPAESRIPTVEVE